MKLVSIQMLRAFAALIVAVFHIGAIERLGISEAGASEPGLVGGFWLNGFGGVDLFFVISGFIMVYVTGASRSGPRTAAAFLFARASRIYPLWWLFASVMLVYFLLVYHVPVDMKHVISRNQTPAEHLIASYLLLPQPNLPLLGIGWTLVHEMYFYLVFALLLLLPRRFLGPGLLVWALIVLAGYFTGLSMPFARNWVTLIVHTMTLEFLAGAGAALLVMSGWRFRPLLMTLAGLAACLAALQLSPDPDRWSPQEAPFMLQWGRVLLYGLPSALLIYGLASLEAEGRFREWKPLTRLGDWSYALYLSHTIVASGLKQMLPRIANVIEGRLPVPGEAISLLRLGSPGPWDNIAFVAISLVAVITFAGLVHTVFEQPVLRLTQALRRRLFPLAGPGLKPRPLSERV